MFLLLVYREIGCSVQTKYTHHTHNHVYHTLVDKEVTNAKQQKNNQSFTYRGFGDTLSDVVFVGGNFAVNVEDGNLEAAYFHLF